MQVQQEISPSLNFAIQIVSSELKGKDPRERVLGNWRRDHALLWRSHLILACVEEPADFNLWKTLEHFYKGKIINFAVPIYRSSCGGWFVSHLVILAGVFYPIPVVFSISGSNCSWFFGAQSRGVSAEDGLFPILESWLESLTLYLLQRGDHWRRPYKSALT